jgi:hypothetical protein
MTLLHRRLADARRTLGRPVVGVVLMIALSSCAVLVPQHACTAIGSVPGVGVTVAEDVSSQLSGVRLSVCWSGRCRQYPVDLRPGATPVGQGCEGSSPDAVCSATVVPDGTLVGFVQIADLPEGPLTVSGSGVRAGRKVRWSELNVQARPSFPNGPDCGAGAPQASVTLRATGLR